MRVEPSEYVPFTGVRPLSDEYMRRVEATDRERELQHMQFNIAAGAAMALTLLVVGLLIYRRRKRLIEGADTALISSLAAGVRASRSAANAARRTRDRVLDKANER